MLAKTIWDTLSAIDVNQHTEKKGQLTYLSWAWAWAELMNNFPMSNYEFLPNETTEAGHVTVWCEIGISDGKEVVGHKMWLPVMDNRNNAIANPDARKISDARMRCLVKCIAMFGLGSYIYAGEDLPVNSVPYSVEQKERFDEYFKGDKHLEMFIFRQELGEEVFAEFFSSFEAGSITANKKALQEMLSRGNALVDVIASDLEGLAKENDPAIVENWRELNKTEMSVVWKRITQETKDFISEQVKGNE